jgi:hypothetical protein
MSNDSIIFIGLDTHKSFIQVAVLQEHRGANPQQLGRIKYNKSALIKLAKQLQSKYPRATLHFVYEAEPCGYWTYRLITSLGHFCYVVVTNDCCKKVTQECRCDRLRSRDHRLHLGYCA